MAAEVIGSIVERDLLDALVSGRARPQDAVGEHMSAPLPMVGSGEPVSRRGRPPGEGRRRGGAGRTASPAGMITRQTCSPFLACRRHGKAQ